MSEIHHKSHRHHRVPLHGRHLLTIGALALLGASGYELWVRMEDFWAWTSGIRFLNKVRGTSFVQDLFIVFKAPKMRILGFKMLFLLGALIFALICLFRRNRASGAWLLIVLDLALAGAGAFMGLYSLHPTNWLQLVKLAPIALIAAGCVVNIAHRAALRRRGHSHSHSHHHSHADGKNDAAA